MPAKPTTLEGYLDTLKPNHREMVEAVLATIRKNRDKKFEEGMQYGMPAFFLPHSVYPNGYHCDASQPVPYASVAARASGVSIYLFGIYCDPAASESLAEAWKATGNRLDMGKSCIRVKKLEQIPLDVLGKSIKQMTAARFVKSYEATVPAAGKKPAKKGAKKSAKKAAKKTARKPAKKAAKKTTKKAAKKTTRRTR